MSGTSESEQSVSVAGSMPEVPNVPGRRRG